MNLAAVHRVCGGKYVGSTEFLDREVSFVTRDSREAGPDCLFAAIPGERTDGHDYLETAFDSGALCALCQRDPGKTRLPYILVDDTQTALGKLAAYYRCLFDIPVIGVTGSVGKTSAKEMIASVLSQRFSVLKTQGNYNNELGVPLTLFGLSDAHEVAVVEMGISDFGEMERLATMVRPTVAVITVVGYAHLEKLYDLEGVLRAKTAITGGMQPDGLLIVNGDDEMLSGFAASVRKLTYGLDTNVDLRAENVRLMEPYGMECEISCGDRRIPIKIHSFGDHMIYAALAGAAVGIHLGLTDKEISNGIASYVPVGRRSKALETGYCILIDDCYNSNPNSVESALRSLRLLSGRRVCILGDMLELGVGSPELHERIGAFAARSADLVITCGEMSRHIHEAAKGTNAIHFTDKSELISELSKLILKGDCVLVKASRGMRFEDISEALLEL